MLISFSLSYSIRVGIELISLSIAIGIALVLLAFIKQLKNMYIMNMVGLIYISSDDEDDMCHEN